MNKIILAALLAVTAGSALAQETASRQTLERLQRETAAMLKTPPRAADNALINRYHLSERGNRIWDAPYPQDDSDPSPAPAGFYLMDTRGLHAYISFGTPGRVFAQVRCRPVSNQQMSAFLCTAPQADRQAVADFEAEIIRMMQSAD